MPYTNGVLLFKKSEPLMPHVVSIIIIAEKYRASLIFICFIIRKFLFKLL